VNALAFSGDGARFAVAGFMGTVSVWDTATGALRGIAGRHDGSVKSVAALPGGGWLSSGRDGWLRVLHADEQGSDAAIEVGPTIVNGVAVDPDGRRAACVSRSRGVEVFDLATGTRLHSYRGHACSARTVAFSKDGRSIAAGYYDGHLLLWRLADRTPRLTRPFGAVPLSTVAFTPGDTSVVVSTWDPHGRYGAVAVASGEIEIVHALARSGQ
jgi:WD40 repeat protein